MKSTAMVAFTILVTASSCARVDAKKEFVQRIPNGANVPGIAALGHRDNTGDSDRLNVFGSAFDTNGLSWNLEMCQDDSDGDGQTNGEELGDPCCEWDVKTNAVVRWSTGLSHPGEKASMSDASLWSNLSCTNVTKISTKAASAATLQSATLVLPLTTATLLYLGS